MQLSPFFRPLPPAQTYTHPFPPRPSVTAARIASCASGPGPSSRRPSSVGPQLQLYTSFFACMYASPAASCASVTVAEISRMPPTCALYATPTPHTSLSRAAATPAAGVPWSSPACGCGSSLFPLKSCEHSLQKLSFRSGWLYSSPSSMMLTRTPSPTTPCLHAPWASMTSRCHCFVTHTCTHMHTHNK